MYILCHTPSTSYRCQQCHDWFCWIFLWGLPVHPPHDTGDRWLHWGVQALSEAPAGMSFETTNSCNSTKQWAWSQQEHLVLISAAPLQKQCNTVKEKNIKKHINQCWNKEFSLHAVALKSSCSKTVSFKPDPRFICNSQNCQSRILNHLLHRS